MADILSFECGPMSGIVSSAISKSSMVKKTCGEAVGSASISLSVEKLFPLPVCVAAIFELQTSADVEPCRPMSANVAVTQTGGAYGRLKCGGL